MIAVGGSTAITTSNLVIKKPATLTFPAAAALITVGVTAWRALIDGGKLKAGQSVSAAPPPGVKRL